MHKQFFLFSLLTLTLFLFVPIPQYTSSDAICKPCQDKTPCGKCPTKGWSFEKPLITQLLNLDKIKNEANSLSSLDKDKEAILQACSNKIDGNLINAVNKRPLTRLVTIFMHAKTPLTSSQLSELNNMGVNINKGSWIPPVNDFPTGYYVGNTSLNLLANICNLNYFVKLNYAEKQFEAQ